MFEDQEKVMKEAKIISTLEEDAMYKFRSILVKNLVVVGEKQKNRTKFEQIKRIKEQQYKNKFRQVENLLDSNVKIKRKLAKRLEGVRKEGLLDYF